MAIALAKPAFVHSLLAQLIPIALRPYDPIVKHWDLELNFKLSMLKIILKFSCRIAPVDVFEGDFHS